MQFILVYDQCSKATWYKLPRGKIFDHIEIMFDPLFVEGKTSLLINLVTFYVKKRLRQNSKLGRAKLFGHFKWRVLTNVQGGRYYYIPITHLIEINIHFNSFTFITPGKYAIRSMVIFSRLSQFRKYNYILLKCTDVWKYDFVSVSLYLKCIRKASITKKDEIKLIKIYDRLPSLKLEVDAKSTIMKNAKIGKVN